MQISEHRPAPRERAAQRSDAWLLASDERSSLKSFPFGNWRPWEVEMESSGQEAPGTEEESPGGEEEEWVAEAGGREGG